MIKSVMQSAAEAECGGLYMNAKEAVPMRITLEELNHPQPATQMRTDNSTADGIMNKTVKRNSPSEWTCNFTGYKIESNKDNLECFGHQER
jgi:hypothetical protein